MDDKIVPEVQLNRDFEDKLLSEQRRRLYKYKLTLCSLNDVLYEQNDEALNTYKTTLFPLFDRTNTLTHFSIAISDYVSKEPA